MKYTRTALGLLTRQYRSVLRKCWLINVGLFALGAAGVMVPDEAEAQVLCYNNSSKVVTYEPNASSCSGSTTQISGFSIPSDDTGIIVQGTNSGKTVMGPGTLTVRYDNTGSDPKKVTRIISNSSDQFISIGRQTDASTVLDLTKLSENLIELKDLAYATMSGNGRYMELNNSAGRIRMTRYIAGDGEINVINLRHDSNAGGKMSAYDKNGRETVVIQGGDPANSSNDAMIKIQNYGSSTVSYMSTNQYQVIGSSYRSMLAESGLAFRDSSNNNIATFSTGGVVLKNPNNLSQNAATLKNTGGNGELNLYSSSSATALSTLTPTTFSLNGSSNATGIKFGSNTTGENSYLATVGHVASALDNYYTQTQIDSTNAKSATSAGLVHQAGTETITGTKTFTNDTNFKENVRFYNQNDDLAITIDGGDSLNRTRIEVGNSVSDTIFTYITKTSVAVENANTDYSGLVKDNKVGISWWDTDTDEDVDVTMLYNDGIIINQSGKATGIKFGSNTTGENSYLATVGHVASALQSYVPTTRTINGKALTGNITLSASDVGALPSTTTIGNATLTIKRNGTAVDTFTANATVDKEINIVDNDTTYTNGNGLSLTGTTFSAKAGDTTITVDGEGIKVGTIAASKVSGLADVATGGNLAASKVTGLADVATGGNLAASKVTGLADVATGGNLAASKVTGLAGVATSGAYSDLSGTPTIGDKLLKITTGGSETSFSANQSSADVSINLDANYVSAVAEGTTNGTIAVTKNGTTTDVAVHGLASVATGGNLDASKVNGLTASRALVSSASGVVTVSDTTATELGYLHGVTSSVQTQINNILNGTTSFDAIKIDGTQYGDVSSATVIANASSAPSGSNTTLATTNAIANSLTSLFAHNNTWTGSSTFDGLAKFSTTNGLQFGSGQNVKGIVTSIGTSGTGATASDEKLPTELAVAKELAKKQNNITGAASSIVSDNLTASMALVSNASGKVAASSTISATELGYLDGVSSNIQTQINTINNNKFDKSSVKTAYNETSVDSTVYSTGYINNELNYGDVNNSTEDGLYSGVKGINTPHVTTKDIMSFVPAGSTPAEAGKARSNSLKQAWEQTGDTYSNSDITSIGSVVASATWGAQSKASTYKSKTYNISFNANGTAVENIGVDHNNMKEAIYNVVKKFTTDETGTIYTNAYLAGVSIDGGAVKTQFTREEMQDIQKVLEQMVVSEDKLTLSETMDSSWNKNSLTEAQKNKMDKYFDSVELASSDIVSYGASNDNIYKKFYEGDKKLHTINTDDTIGENMVRLDAVIGKIEQGAGGNVKNNQTIGENLKALDDTLGSKLEYTSGNLGGITTATGAIKKLNELIGKNTSFDFTQKSVADVLADMPSVDQSSLVHTSGDEKINGFKSFRDAIRANGGIQVYNVTQQQVVGANWSSQGYKSDTLIHVKIPQDGGGYIEDDRYMEFTFNNGYATGADASAQKTAAKTEILGAWQGNEESGYTNQYISNLHYGDYSKTTLNATEKAYVDNLLNNDNITNTFTYTNKYDDVLDDPKFTVNSQSGNTHVYGTLQADGLTTLSPTNGLTFDGQTVVKSISTAITGDGSADSLATTGAVAGYVGKGKLTLSVNGTTVTGEFGANDANNTTINLGTDFIKDSHVIPVAAIKENNDTEAVLINADNRVGVNLTNLANYSNRILAGTKEFAAIKLGDAAPITAWATTISAATTGQNVPVDTKLATEKAVATYIGSTNNLTTTNKNDIVSAINEVKSTVTTDYYTKSEINNTTAGAGLVHRAGSETIAGTKTFNDAMTLNSTLDVTGATTLGSTLGVTGKTTLSAAQGLSFGEQTTVAKSIITSISGASDTALVTESAVKNYVGNGSLTLTINDSTKTAFTANQSGNLSIDLGDYVTQAQSNDDKGKVLYVNNSGNVDFALVTNDMLSGDIAATKLATGVQTSLGKANTALQKENIDGSTILYDNTLNQLKVGKITNDNINDGAISISKLGSLGQNNALVVTDTTGKLTTSSVTTDDLSNLHGLTENLAAKLDKVGGTMTGNITFATSTTGDVAVPTGIVFGNKPAVTDVSIETMNTTPSTSTLVTEQAVANYVGNATIRMQINGSPVETSFTTNQSGDTPVIVDLGSYVTETQAASAKGKVLTVNAETAKVEATTVSNGMLAGEITKDKFVETVRTSLGLADTALQTVDIKEGATDGTISVRNVDIAVHGLGSAAYADEGDFATANHGHFSSAISKMDGYTTLGDGVTGTILTTDTLNQAIAKLENGLGGKQEKLTAADDSIVISGNTIRAVGVTYSAATDGGLSLDSTTHEFSIAAEGVTNAMLQGGIAQSKITNLTSDLASKLDTSVFNARTINTKALSEDVILGAGDIRMTDYQKAASATAVAQNDTINQAIGKLEKAIEGKQTLSAGDNIDISNGVISAVDTKYIAAAGGGLSLADGTNAFSIANGGVTNAHINSNAGIETSKLALNTGTANTTIYYDADGHFVNGKLTGAQIADGTIAAANLTTAVQTALGKAGSALQKADITTGGAQGTISVGGTDVSVYGLGSAAFTNSNAYAAASHTHTSEDITSLYHYVKSATGDIEATDSLNTAISKLETGLSGKQKTLIAGEGISINQTTGEITATGAGGGAYYYADANGGLSLSEDHKFSIKPNGVTNDMLQGGITKAKLETSVQTSLNKANSALQEASITSGDVAGAIKVGDTSVAVYGLADVAKGGSLAADKVTQDDSHKFVTNDQITSWTGKQDAISDLNSIRTGAEHGESAYNTVTANKAAWDSKLSSVSITQGSTNGTISVSVNGAAATDVAVKGLGTAAYKADTYFAPASHNHGSANVTNLSGYSMASIYTALREEDTLNVALGKLEKGLADKQGKLVEGSNITITGNVISATDSDTTYTTPAAGGLIMNGTAISINTGGVTNAMLAGNIAKTKLASDVQASLGLADSALQAGDIASGTTPGSISVDGTDVLVGGLAAVATGGNLAASKVTTDTTHQFVTNNQISAWNSKLDAATFNDRKINGHKLNQDVTLDGSDIGLTGYAIADAYTPVDADDSVNSAIGKLEKGLTGKQDTISDLATIRSKANKGKDAYDIVVANQDTWDAKVGSVSLTTGTTNGTVALSINGGAATEVSVAGLGTAAYQADTYFAKASHNHVASEIDKMTGYTKATSTTYAAISANDTLNQAIGKLEYALDTKQGTLTAGTGITIDSNGRISATGGGAAYTAAPGGGLALNENAFSIASGGVSDAMLAGNISQSKISGLTEALGAKLNTATFNARTINNKALSSNITLGGGDIPMTNYTKASESVAITTSDTVNTAIGKLEKALETQTTIQAGKHIEIDEYGKINATYSAGTNINIDEETGVISATGAAAPYIAATDGGLSLDTTNNAFSIAEKGVTSAMLAQAVQDTLGKAESALQKADITSGSANGTISVDGTDVAVKGLAAVATGGDLAAANVTESTTRRFVSDSEKATWGNKVGSITAATAVNNGSVALSIDGTPLEVAVKGLGTAAYKAATEFAAASHNHATSDITTLGGYGTDTSDGALDASDSLNVALHKLENNINKNKLTAGNNVTIGADGKINATDTKYSAAATGGLTKDASNAFSIATGGVTSTMLAGEIGKDKLDSEVTGLLTNAGTAIQTVKVNNSPLMVTDNAVNIAITSGTDAGAINVNGTKVAVYGLADVATGGDLAASKVTTDATHRFVADTDIEAWNAKQNAISDLTEIRSNATAGKSASDTLATKASVWDAKIGEVSAASGNAPGKIALTVDGNTTQVSVAGLGSAAYKADTYFALASHSHVASAIEAMTGYEIASAYSDIAETDSLNDAIGKLEKGVKANQLTAGTGIDITNGVISATGTGGAIYHAGAGLALDDTTKTFSVSGVTNAMLGEAIVYNSLASGIQTSLGKADTALQPDDITEGTTAGAISVKGTPVAVHGLKTVATTGAAADLTTDATHRLVADTDINAWNSKIGSIAAGTASNNGSIALTINGSETPLEVEVKGLKSAAFSETSAFAAASHTHKSSEVNSLEGYVIANEAADVAATDTLNQALGKLQKSIKANKLTAGTNIDITNGVISATDTTYGVATNGGLALDANNKFSIASEGVTNAMLKGNITKAKLDSGVQASLGLADTALQAADITVGGTPGTISVKGGDVAVNGLKNVATTGAAADLTTDATHRLVTDTEKETWNGKQDAIDDLTTIRTNATAGKSASDTLAAKESVWDSKLSSISLTTGTTDGTLALSINGGAVTEVAVGGLGTAAYQADTYFALASHTHVSSAINAMTGYAKATETTYAPISTSDTLNQAIGKLEYGLGTKQKTLTPGAGISITSEGVISVTGGGSGAYYSAGAGLDLDGTTNTFSIADNGVSNAMLAGGISNDKLALNNGGTGSSGKVLYYDTNGVLTSGLLTTAQLDPDANIQKGQLSVEVRNALTNAANAVTVSDFTPGSTQGTISVDGTDVAVKGLGSAAFTNSTAYAASSHTHTSADVDLMTGYTKYTNANPIEAGDSLNVAIGKLEKGLEGKQKTLVQGSGITINQETGEISATGSGGATYTAGAGLALSGTNVFSIAPEGITNGMIKDGEIAKDKLASAVKDLLDAADTALQPGDITEGTTNGAISVNGNAVKVHGLADVATTGAAADLQTDADHRLVSDTEKTAWNNKQDAISDLTDIRNNATAGKNASDTLTAKADTWDAKVDSISTATGEGSNGKIAVTANGVTTQVAVAGLKAGAFKEVDSAVTENSDKLITSGAVKSYVASIDGNSIHQSGNEDITGTKTFKKLQKFEKVISSGDDAGTYTTELDGDTLKLNKGLETRITLDGKDGSAAFAGLLSANGGISTTTLVVSNGMTVTGNTTFKDNVTIGSTTSGGSRDLTVNGGINATGKTTLSADNGLSFGDGQEVTSIVNSITGSGNALKKQLVTAAAVKAADDALSDRIDDIADDVAARDAAIAQNTSDIAANKTAIAANTAAIASQATTISQHTTDIAQNKADIAANTAAIASQAATIAGHTSQIAANTSAISGLDSRVTTIENTTLDLTGVREAMGGQFDSVTHKWSANVTTDKGVTYGTLPATDLVEAISKVNSNIGDGAVLDTIESRTTFAANNGVSSTKTVNENISAVNATVGDMNKLNTEFKNLTNGGSSVPATVVTALNNLDATLGTIHGLADKRKAAGTYKGNLAEGTTVEMHLSKLDDAIGDRTTISNEKGSRGYAFSTETMYVADVLTDIASQIGTAEQLSGAPNGVSKDKTVNQNIAAVSKAVGNVADLKDTYFLSETTNLTDAVRVLDADMYKVAYAVDQNKNEINSLRRKLRGGMASLSALSALAPNSRADGKTQLSIGTGMYESSPAVAVGAYHWLTNNLMVNAGLAWGDADDAVYRLGLTYSF